MRAIGREGSPLGPRGKSATAKLLPRDFCNRVMVVALQLIQSNWPFSSLVTSSSAVSTKITFGSTLAR